MTLSRAIGNAYSGLSNSAYRADVTASNIANASTPGYVRRSAISVESVVGGYGNGVRTAGVERHQDVGVSRLRREADGSAARADVLAGAYSLIDRELGVPGESNSLFSGFSALETSLRELASTPESPALQNSVLVASTELAFQFNSLSSFANTMRSNADKQIGASVQTVNDALHRLKDINGDIAGRQAASSDTVALEDERQRLLDTIGEIIPIKDHPREGGQVDVVTQNGVVLLAGSVNELEFRPSAVVTADNVYRADNTGLSGVYVGEQNLTPAANGNFSLSSGKLSGYFSIRDNVGTEFQAEIDALAGDLISRFSDDSIDSTKPAGAPGIFTDAGGPLNPANTAGLAGRLSLNAAIDPSQGGTVTRFRDGLAAATEGPKGQSDILLNMVEAMTSVNAAPAGSKLGGVLSSSDLVAQVSSMFGEGRIRHESLALAANTRASVLKDAEIQASGVDTDYELQNMLVIEQAYAANARVVQTVGDMLDRLLQL